MNDKDTISRQAAIDAARDWYEGLICGSFKGLEKRLQALPPAQPNTIPVEWIQRYADDWEDMNYAYDNPILGMLEDWRREQDE